MTFIKQYKIKGQSEVDAEFILISHSLPTFPHLNIKKLRRKIATISARFLPFSSVMERSGSPTATPVPILPTLLVLLTPSRVLGCRGAGGAPHPVPGPVGSRRWEPGNGFSLPSADLRATGEAPGTPPH